MVARLAFVAVSVLVLTGAKAPKRKPVPKEPASAECRDTAAHCREAFTLLEQCEAETKDKKPEDGSDPCASERTSTDTACKSSNTTCKKDHHRK